METIGYLYFPGFHITNLKRLALLFDKLAIDDQTWDRLKYDENIGYDGIAEFEWLRSEGIFTILAQDIPDEITVKPEIFDAVKPGLAASYAFEYFGSKLGETTDEATFWLETQLENSFSRFACLAYRAYLHMNIFPVLRTPIISIDKIMDKKDIYELVVRNLPMPEINTPWEKIIEFRKDEDARIKLQALKVWISDIAHQELAFNEVHDKLQYLLQDYKSSMDLHRMKTNSGTLETILVSTSEFAENLVRLQPSKAIKSLFGLKNRKIALFEAEKSAPGREIAYIVKAHEQFGGSLSH